MANKSTLPSKEAKEIARLVKPHGWTWEHNGGHVKFRGPNGGLVVMPSSKFSDHRIMKNLIRDFRKQGCPL